MLACFLNSYKSVRFEKSVCRYWIMQIKQIKKDEQCLCFVHRLFLVFVI